MDQENENRAPRTEESRTELRGEERDERRNGDIEIPAIRHIGKTLESDPEYFAVATPGDSTPEARIAAEAGPIEVERRQILEDDFDPLAGRSIEDHPEKLRTRLPGDHSSDPHTDLGPDNATNLQQQPDVPGADKRNRA